MPLTEKYIISGLEEYDVVNGEMHVWGRDVRDEYHSMDELYAHRCALTAAFFNLIHNIDMSVRGFAEVMAKPLVFKSKNHHEGEMFPGYFIVMTIAPIGQISYHYKLSEWEFFRIPEVDRPPKWDGHDSKEVIERLKNF